MNAYISYSFNASEAARAVKLKQPAVLGCRWLTKVHIRTAIEERLEQSGVTRAMVKCRLAEQAFSSMGDLLSFDKKGAASLDLAKARRLRRLHLIGKIKERTYWDKSKQAEVKEIEVENYSAQAALFKLAAIFGLLDKQEPAKGPEAPQGHVRYPMRGSLSLEAWSDAANGLEPIK